VEIGGVAGKQTCDALSSQRVLTLDGLGPLGHGTTGEQPQAATGLGIPAFLGKPELLLFDPPEGDARFAQ
jgi:hypothetical protein